MNEDNHARDQAKAQLESILSMVKALNVDYDRLGDLKDYETCLSLDDAEELTQLIEDANGCESYDEAYTAIQEDPLSVQVRTGWYSPGGHNPDPEEFEILLCTGGPAVRILGDLPPSRAWIQYQDWGTPWTNYPLTSEEEEAVLEYCRQFYFGD